MTFIAKLSSARFRAVRRWPLLRVLFLLPSASTVAFLILISSIVVVCFIADIANPSGFIDHQGNFAFYLKNAVLMRRNFSNGLLVFGGALIDKQGKRVGSKNLVAGLDCTEGLACVRMRNGLVGFIDAQGRFIIPPRYAQAFSFSEGLAAVLIDKQWGYIDRDGKQLIAAQFDKVLPFSEGLACISTNGKINYIDHTGRVVIKTRFDFGGPFIEGRAIMGSVNRDNSIGRVVCAGKRGEVVFESSDEKTFGPPQGNPYLFKTDFEPDLTWLYVGEMRPGLHAGSSDFDFHPLSGNGNLGHFSNGLLLIRSLANLDKYGYLDMNGQLIIPAQYQTASEFSEGLAAVSTAPKSTSGTAAPLYGFIDKTGAFKIAPQYVSAFDFHEGLARVRRRGAGDEFIDRSGKVVLVAPGGEAGDFHDGLAPVGKEQYY